MYWNRFHALCIQNCTEMKRSLLIILSIIILCTLVCLGLILGSVKFSDINSYIILKIRLPRTIGAVVVGAALASSGLIYQSVFKNPIADSYMLGVSSSASFAVCLAMLFFKTISKSIYISVFALLGSILSIILIYTNKNKNIIKLLLKGIALNFFFSAATTLLICINHQQLDSILFWTMGSLSNLTWTKIVIIASVFVITLIIEYKERYTLDLFLLDEETAISSGINTYKKKLYLLLVSTISTAIVVSFCGVIGFIGMLCAHVARILLGPNHNKLLIPTSLFGSILLLFSDIVSRTVVAPSELPIGVITSILGAPFLFAMIKENKTWIE